MIYKPSQPLILPREVGSDVSKNVQDGQRSAGITKSHGGRVIEIEATLEMRECADQLITRATDPAIDMNFSGLATRGGNEIKRVMSPEVRKACDAFGQRKSDVLVVRGAVTIPEDLEPSPRDGDPTARARAIEMTAAYYLPCVGATPIAYLNENNGHPIRDIVTKTGHENEASSHGRATHNHTEHAQRPDDGRDDQSAAPDFFCFVCLRNEKGISTNIAFPEPVLKMRTVTLELTRCEFDFDPSESTTDVMASRGLPILTYTPAGPKFRYNDAKLRKPVNENQRAALEVLRNHLTMDAANARIVLRPGDILLVSQRRVVHRHGGGDVFDPNRWLARIYGMANDSIMLPAKGVGKAWVLD